MYKGAVPVPMDNTNKRMRKGHCWSLMLIPERAKHRRSLRIGRRGPAAKTLVSSLFQCDFYPHEWCGSENKNHGCYNHRTGKRTTGDSRRSLRRAVVFLHIFREI